MKSSQSRTRLNSFTFTSPPSYYLQILSPCSVVITRPILSSWKNNLKLESDTPCATQGSSLQHFIIRDCKRECLSTAEWSNYSMPMMECSQVVKWQRSKYAFKREKATYIHVCYTGKDNSVKAIYSFKYLLTILRYQESNLWGVGLRGKMVTCIFW